MSIDFSEVIDRIRELDGVEIRPGVPLSDYTTIRIGGPCAALVEVRDPGALIACMKLMRREGFPPIEHFILGGGSNLLVNDRGFDGIILKLGEGFTDLIDAGNVLTVGAGYPLKDLSRQGVKSGWGGMECFVGLPGTVGGAVRMNAGAWGREIWDFISWVHGVDRNGTERAFSRAEVTPGYRNGGLSREIIVTRIGLAYVPEKPVLLKKRARQYMTRRKKGQAVRYPSFGSVFKNPTGFHAGKLIDNLGLRGRREGDAMISDAHANFIVNMGHARASDVLILMREMKRGVRESYGIELEPEVVFLGMTLEELEGIS